MTSQATSADPLIATLVERGVTPRKARRIAARYSAARILDQLNFYDFELNHGTRPDPVWLVDRIVQTWRAPEGYAARQGGTATSTLWQEQSAAARRIRQRFGVAQALTYLVGQKFFGRVRDLELDRSLSPEVDDFAAEIRKIFAPDELREYFKRARPRRHPGEPTDDLRYLPEEALFVTHMKMLLIREGDGRPG